MSHLTSFDCALRGKGRARGSDLPVHIWFSNHVVSRRALHGETPHVRDQNGTGRIFSDLRYTISLTLPAVISNMIGIDALSYLSRSYGGAKNLITVRGTDGMDWAIVFCFRPDPSGDAVHLDVLSAYEKVVNQREIARKNLSYFARQCLFEGRRVP